MKIKKGRLVILCLVIAAVVITTIILTRPKFVPLSRYKTDKETVLRLFPLAYKPTIEQCYYKEGGNMWDRWLEAFIYLNDDDFNYYMDHYELFEYPPSFRKNTDPQVLGEKRFEWYALAKHSGEKDEYFSGSVLIDTNNKIIYMIVFNP